MSSQRTIIGYTAELERQAWDDEGREKDRQKALSGASEGDGLALGGLEGPSSAGVSATANLQGVTSRFDWYLDRVVHLERSGTLTVNHDVVRATSDLDPDCFMRHLQGCCHLRSPLSVGRATAPSSSPERVSAHRLDPVNVPGGLVRLAAIRLTSRTGGSRQTSGSLAGLRLCMVMHAGIRWRVSCVTRPAGPPGRLGIGPTPVHRCPQRIRLRN